MSLGVQRPANDPFGGGDGQIDKIGPHLLDRDISLPPNVRTSPFNESLGFLALLVLLFVSPLLRNFPQTLDPHAWFVGAAAFGPVVLLVLAVYGFWVSVGGQRLVRDELLEARSRRR